MSILQTHAAAAPITVTHEVSMTGTKAEVLWDAYRAKFEPLAELAVQQHFYSRDEVLAELLNPRITKIVGWQDDRPVGLAMVTNSLEDVPQISPAFLRTQYPEHAARNTIYVGIFVLVAPGVRGLTLFTRLTTEMWQVPALVGGDHDRHDDRRIRLRRSRARCVMARSRLDPGRRSWDRAR